MTDRHADNHTPRLTFELNCNVDINVTLKVLCTEGHSTKINTNSCKFISDKAIFLLSME